MTQRSGWLPASVVESRVELMDAALFGRERQAASTICSWIANYSSPVVLAVDAPLGWPIPLADTLGQHQAGEAITVPANAMFRRTTDLFIKAAHGKMPLDVGADRIARTAHAALHLPGQLRSTLKLPIPLVWNVHEIDRIGVIEVYPAATLKAHGLRSNGYKGRETSSNVAKSSPGCTLS